MEIDGILLNEVEGYFDGYVDLNVFILFNLKLMKVYKGFLFVLFGWFV